MKGIRDSFPRRLSRKVILLASALFVVAIGFTAHYSAVLISKESKKVVEEKLDAVCFQVQAKLSKAEIIVQNLSWTMLDYLHDEKMLYELTRKALQDNPDLLSCSIAFRENYIPGRKYYAPYTYRDPQSGEFISEPMEAGDYDYLHEEWFQIPLYKKKANWSEPYYDGYSTKQVISSYSLPLLDDKGEVYALITVDIGTQWFSELISKSKPYEKSILCIATRCGSFVAALDRNLTTGETVYSVLARYVKLVHGTTIKDVRTQMLKGEKGTMEYNYAGHRYFTSYAPMANGWTIILGNRYKDILKGTHDMRIILTLISILGLIMLFLFCKSIVNKQTEPLIDFCNAADNVAKGDFDSILPTLKHKDEIMKLRDCFENMQMSLVNYVEELKKTTSAKERIESELNIATRIQMDMLHTDFPEDGTADLFATLHPAKEVGGDLYDYFIKDRWLYFVIGDVSGKGVPAAMFMSMTLSAFRLIAPLDISIREVVGKINDFVSRGNKEGLFVTMFTARLNLDTGLMQYCNAGHNPIVVKDKDNKAHFLDQERNLVLGAFEGFPFKEQEIQLGKGSKLLLYTDGVTEAETADYSQFGEEALLQWADGIPEGTSAKEAVASLESTVEKFADGNPQNDDITIMAIGI